MDDDLKSASNSMSDLPNEPKYAPTPGKHRKRGKTKLVVIAALILIIFAGFAFWNLFLNKPKTETPVATTPAPTVTEEESPAGADVPDASATETFKSSTLGVTLTHPTTWKVTEASGGVRIESPEFNYQTVDKGTVTGNFRVYIRKGSRDIDGTYIGRGVAIKPSEKLTYTQPAPGQRTETLLSSFGYDTSDNFAFFLIAGNFQLNKEDTLGPDYGKEPDTFIVGGGYSGTELVDDFAFNQVLTETYDQTNAYEQAHDIIESLQLR